MGNELDRPMGRTDREIETLAALMALGGNLDASRLRQGGQSSGDLEVEHGWDPDDCSKSMKVLENGKVVERSALSVLLPTTDAVRGKKGYRMGTHIWEIHWPVDQRGSNAVVGVSTYGSPLKHIGYSSLVGSNDESVGWDLSRNVLLYNDCIMRRYPDGKSHNTFKAPEVITVILNMTLGTISFKGGGERYDDGVALSGLKKIGKPLCPTISATKDGCKVRIRYMGDRERVSPQPSPRSSIPTFTTFTGYKFNSKSGSEIMITNGGLTAGRKRPLQEYKNGVVLTAQPLQPGRMFEVQIDKKIAKSAATGSLEIGVTTNNPNELDFPNIMTECTEGKTWMYSGSTLVENGEERCEMGTDMDALKLGDKVGLMLTINGNVKFYINGDPLKLGIKGPPGTLYAVVDVYGQTTQVTIQNVPSVASQVFPTTPQAKAAKPDEPTSTPTSSARSSQLTFHRKCGKNITLQNDNRTAERNKFTEVADEAIVFSSRPLKPNELFEITIDRSVNKWDGHLKLGVINPPLELVSGLSTEHNAAGKWYWTASRVVHKGDSIKKLEYSLNDLKDGSKVGVMRKLDGSLHFFFNGRDLGVAATDLPQTVHGVVDVYGDTVQVSMSGSEADDASSGVSPQREAQVKTESDVHTLLDKVKETVDLMRNKRSSIIGLVGSAIVHNLNVVYNANRNKQLRQALGDFLADIGAGKVIVEYLQFLRESGIQDDTTWQTYDALHNACLNYTDASLKLATELGKAGIVLLFVEDLNKFKENYVKGKKSYDILLSALSILHNCVKASEVRHMLLKSDVVNAIKPYTLVNNDDLLIMISLLTLSYIADSGQRHLIQANEDSIGFIVKHLKEAVNEPTTHQSKGFHAYEIATGLAQLAGHPSNRKLIVNKGAVQWLTQLMKIGSDTEIECAANAIWSLTSADSLDSVKRTPELLKTVLALEGSRNESVKAAAKRINIKFQAGMMQQMPSGMPGGMKIECDYQKSCKLFLKSLDIPETYFSSKYDLCYCTSCHAERKDTLYYTRGKPPRDYGLPIGWCRFSFKLPPKAEPLKADAEWHRAYHGTKKESIHKVLQTGELLIPGDVALGGKKLAEEEGHFNDKRKPEGFDTKRIFVSPSIRYSGHEAYATPSKYKEERSGKDYKAKVAIQVLIRPESYSVGQQTIGAKTEIDPKFSNQEIEWSTKERGATILYGLLIKLEEAIE